MHEHCWHTAHGLSLCCSCSLRWEKLFCIDFGGRNHGVNESVYVNADKLVTFLKAEGIIQEE